MMNGLQQRDVQAGAEMVLLVSVSLTYMTHPRLRNGAQLYMFF